MNESVEKILSRVDEEFREAIQRPEEFDFKKDDPYKQVVDPEPVGMETAVVDLQNQNVKVRYSTQSPRENYTCVKRDPRTEIALVESDAVHENFEGTKVTSTVHYLIDDENVYRLENTGYEKTQLQQRPLEVADEYEKLYRQVLKADDQEKASVENTLAQGLESVPSPEKDSLFEL